MSQFEMIVLSNSLPIIPSVWFGYEDKINFYRAKYDPINPQPNLQPPNTTFRKINVCKNIFG